jgi:hypothetical protein
VPEILDPRYVLHDTHEWTIKSHPQEIMENGVDFAHFATLHGWKCKAIHWEPDGPYYRLKIDVDTGAEDQAATASVTTDVDSFNSGPGFLYTRFKGEMDGIAVNALTPIGPEKLHIMHRYYAHERCKPEVVKAFYEFYVNDYNLDIPIWSNKIYRERPLLAEPKKTSAARRWYAVLLRIHPPPRSPGAVSSPLARGGARASLWRGPRSSLLAEPAPARIAKRRAAPEPASATRATRVAHAKLPSHAARHFPTSTSSSRTALRRGRDRPQGRRAGREGMSDRAT